MYLSNLGKTKGFPNELHIGLTIGNRLPKIPVYTAKHTFPISSMLTENEREIRLIEFPFDAPFDIYEQLRAKTVNVWFYCNLIYLDFMDERHEAAFCWQRQEGIGAGSFVRDPTPAYNRKT